MGSWLGATNRSDTSPAGNSLSWKTLPVGGGGWVRGLIVAADGTMVGRTDTAGAYLWNAGTSSWSQLVNSSSMPAAYIATNPINLGLPSGTQGVYEVAIAPLNTSIFYMNYGGYIFSSANAGTTWAQTAYAQDTSSDANSTPYAQSGQKMAVDPNNSNIVYAGSQANGLSVTINGGTSWSAVSGVPSGTGAGLVGILFYPGGGQVGGVTQVIYACSNGNGVYKTTNGGTTWALTTGGPTSIIYAAIDTSGNYYAIVGTGSNGGTSLAKYSSGTWTTTSAPSNGNTLQAVAINPFNQSEIAIVSGGGQMALSYDAGSTWTAINQAFTLVSNDIPWLKQANYSVGDTFYSLTAGGLQFSPITNGQLIQSAGTGVWSVPIPSSGFTATTVLSWTDMTVGIENLVANTILVPPVVGSSPILGNWDRAFFKLTPGTYPSTYGSVNSVTIIMGWSLDYASSDPNTVVGLSDWNNELSGYSTDGGATWTYFASVPPNLPGSGSVLYLGGCIAASTPSNIVWSPGNSSNPYYSTNQGASWTAITLPGVSSWANYQFAYYLDVRSVTADRVNANTFYLYFAGHGVFRSTDGGATWSNVYSGNGGYIETNSSYSGKNSWISSVPGNAGHLFYTSGWQSGSTLTTPTNNPMYRSTDGGVTWTAVANVLAVSCFGFGAPGPSQTYPAIYIYGWVNNVLGVWQSIDNCVTWTNLGAFPAGVLVRVSAISGDPNIYNRVYVGFGGGGYAYYG